MNAATFNSIRDILVKDFHLPSEQIVPATPLVELGLDSLALMEFVFAVEDAFRLRIPEDRLDPRSADLTLQNLCDVIDAAIAASSTGAVAVST